MQLYIFFHHHLQHAGVILANLISKLAGKGQVCGPSLRACLTPGACSLKVPHPQGLRSPGWL